MIQGTLYIVSAPSGTGKSSLIQAILKTKTLYNVQLSISHTTRAMRPGEKNGEHYFFISKKEFELMMLQNVFLEYATVFGNYYGTSRIKIEQMLTKGIDVFLDIDWQGAQQVRQAIPESRSIFILPPSKEELSRRLRTRAQDNEEIIINRMVKSIIEISHYSEYDYLIVNDNFDLALSDLKSIIFAERLHVCRQKIYHNALIRKLLSN